MRSYAFLIVVLLSIFIGYFCVPAKFASYEVFYIGGIRGIYNSAWLGSMAAMISTLLLWIFGFYMLRSQISEDQRLKLGQIIASTPISKFKYIFSKLISNFIVLMAIEIFLLIAFMAMQLLRGEEYNFYILDYIAPLLFITLPSLLLLAALTVFFDVFPGIKGTAGNLIFFFLWIFISVMSIANPNNIFDLFGLNVILSDMVEEVLAKFPHMTNSLEGGSFGYYPIEGGVTTFRWQGITWDYSFLGSRIIWVAIAIIILILSSLVFNRFKEIKINNISLKSSIYDVKETLHDSFNYKDYFYLSPIKKEKNIPLFRLIKYEFIIMLKGLPILWYLLTICLLISSFLIPLSILQGWLPILMLLPLSIWAQMGTREKHYNIYDSIFRNS